MSTSVGDPAAGGKWRLHPRVSLRREAFGALAYHYDSRQLTFLRSPELVTVLRELESQSTPRAAFDEIGVPGQRWPAFASALRSLARSGFIVPFDPSGAVSERSDEVDATGTGSAPAAGATRR